jgi:hypothetical protein
VTVLPDHRFIRLIRPAQLELEIKKHQKDEGGRAQLKEWQDIHNLERHKKHHWMETVLVVVWPQEVAKRLMEIYHNGPTAGDPGRAKTFRDLMRHYWWPEMRKFVQEYITRCAICQASKIATHRNNPDLKPIPPVEGATPFQTIMMDLIVKLPKSKGYDSIATITDHNCMKGMILIPCLETMGAEDLAEEYKQRAFPYIGLPQKIISDRDTQFTSHFAKEICRQLRIKQNISSTYHPQTDSQSEKTNQHVEMALWIFCNFQQNDWAEYLPVVQYMLNTRVSETTKKAPFELWMGFIPQSHQPDRPSSLPRVEWHKSRFKEIREQAQSAMKRAQVLYLAKGKFRLYQKGDEVWLEAKNLKTTHPTTKLCSLWYGPFKITEVISDVTYRLDLPIQWKIHNVFHASSLMPYKEMPEHGKNFKRPLPEIVDGEEHYEVKAILGSKRVGRNKRLKYLLAWEGYTDADNSWEFADAIKAPKLIQEFHQKNPTAIKVIWVERRYFGMSDSSVPPASYTSPIPRSIYDPYEDRSDPPSTTTSTSTPPLVHDQGPTTSASSTIETLIEDMAALSVRQVSQPVEEGSYHVMSPPQDATEAEPAGPSWSNPRKNEEGSLLPVMRLPTPPGITMEELQDDMRSSEEESVGAGELRPAHPNEAASIIDLTTPDAEMGELPQEPPVAADGGGVHLGEGWFENGYGCVHMDIWGEDGRTCPAKFIHFKKVNGELMVFGTMGAGHLEYMQPLMAAPCYDVFPFTTPEEGGYPEFRESNSLNQAPWRGVEMLGDMGLIGEVERWRRLSEEARALTRKEVECVHKEKELIKDFRELREGKEWLKRKRDKTEAQLIKSQVHARITEQLEPGQDIDLALGGSAPSWTQAFQSCQDNRRVFSFHQPHQKTNDKALSIIPSASAPRQLPRIVASPPGTWARLVGERLERADESSLSSGRSEPASSGRTSVSFGERERIALAPVRPCNYCGKRGHPSFQCYNPHIDCGTSCNVVDMHHYYLPWSRCHASSLYDRTIVRSTHLAQQALWEPPLGSGRSAGSRGNPRTGTSIYGPRTSRREGERYGRSDADSVRRDGGRNLDPDLDYSAEAREASYERPLTPGVYSRDGVKRMWANIQYTSCSLVWPVPRTWNNFHEVWYNRLRPPYVPLAAAKEPYDPNIDYSDYEVDLPEGWAESNDRGD